MNNDLMPPNPQSYTQVEILGEVVEINWLSEAYMNDAYGSCHTEDREIRIRDNLDGIKCLDTLQHEILHYISDITNIDLSEHQVHLLGMALANFYLTNPQWLGFVAERCQEEDERRKR